MRGDTGIVDTKAEMEALQIFVDANKGKTAKLSEEEFITAARSSPTFIGLMQFIR